MRFSHIFFHGLALRLGMTTPTTVLRRSAATARLLTLDSRLVARCVVAGKTKIRSRRWYRNNLDLARKRSRLSEAKRREAHPRKYRKAAREWEKRKLGREVLFTSL
jgi:hypothetical protein